MSTLPMISQLLPDGMNVLASIDIDGFLSSTSFLTTLATAISTFILSILNLFLGGVAPTAT